MRGGGHDGNVAVFVAHALDDFGEDERGALPLDPRVAVQRHKLGHETDLKFQ